MQEEPIENVNEQEVYAQEEPHQDVAQEDVQTQEPAHAATPERAQQQNFRQLRQQKEAVEQELLEARRRLQEIDARSVVPNDDDDDFGIGNDDLAEGKHLRKVNKKVKDLERQLAAYEQQTVETRLLARYPDFDSVVSEGNITALAEQYPEIARTIDSSKDVYSKASAAYTMIKKLGIGQPNEYDANKGRAEKNAAKPKPLASMSPQQGNSPLSNANAFANGLTPELRAQLRKEMEDARKGY